MEGLALVEWLPPSLASPLGARACLVFVEALHKVQEDIAYPLACTDKKSKIMCELMQALTPAPTAQSKLQGVAGDERDMLVNMTEVWARQGTDQGFMTLSDTCAES